MSKSYEELVQTVQNCMGLKNMETRVTNALHHAEMPLSDAIDKLQQVHDNNLAVSENGRMAMNTALAVMRAVQIDVPYPNDTAFSDIASFYGVDHQLVKAMEELGELQTAIAKYKLATPSTITDAACNLVEEMADVYIMVMQLRLMFSSAKFDEVVKYKLKRQQKRMSMEE